MNIRIARFVYSYILLIRRVALYIAVFFHALSLFAQAPIVKEKSVDEKYLNWYNEDEAANDVPGISTERAYNELLKDRKSHTIIVAVIDGGIDTAHEDLKGKIWTNEKEIPGNGIDDDHNGFIDDVHGWNFLGNSKGQNIEHETMEVTRLYKKYSDRFGDKSAKEISPDDKEDYRIYQEVAAAFLKEVLKARQDQQFDTRFREAFHNADSIIKNYLKHDDYTIDDLKIVKSYRNEVNDAASLLIVLKENNLTESKLESLKKHDDDRLTYDLNTDYNPRDSIIGDDPTKLNDMHYGNNDVVGPNPAHGTFIAGIIAACRNNGIGVDGIADNVQIMPIRAIPDGDERDKDVANAIRYAVDNGAQVINMSFGKEYSPQKQFVDEAMLYAESKGVLLIHAAGNDSKDNDKTPDFPSPITINGKEVNDFITVGASTVHADKRLVAYFSNYGRKTVDLFAPGENIYGLAPHDKYELGDGTSYAAPMVTATATLLKSYFPQLTAQQIRNIITQSGTQYKLRVYKPSENGRHGKKKFYKLSATGREVNVYNAVKMAEQVKSDMIK